LGGEKNLSMWNVREQFVNGSYNTNGLLVGLFFFVLDRKVSACFSLAKSTFYLTHDEKFLYSEENSVLHKCCYKSKDTKTGGYAA